MEAGSDVGVWIVPADERRDGAELGAVLGDHVAEAAGVGGHEVGLHLKSVFDAVGVGTPDVAVVDPANR